VEWFTGVADEKFPMIAILPIQPLAKPLFTDPRMVEIANHVNIRPGFTVHINTNVSGQPDGT